MTIVPKWFEWGQSAPTVNNTSVPAFSNNVVQWQDVFMANSTIQHTSYELVTQDQITELQDDDQSLQEQISTLEKHIEKQDKELKLANAKIDVLIEKIGELIEAQKNLKDMDHDKYGSYYPLPKIRKSPKRNSDDTKKIIDEIERRKRLLPKKLRDPEDEYRMWKQSMEQYKGWK